MLSQLTKQKKMSKEVYTTLRVHSNNCYRTPLCYVLYINSNESNYSDLWKFDQIYNGIASARSPKNNIHNDTLSVKLKATKE